MICNSVFSLFLSPILVVVLLRFGKEIYIPGTSDVYIQNLIDKTSFFTHKSPCLPLKMFKLLNKTEERSNNVRKTVVIFPHIFRETLCIW